MLAFHLFRGTPMPALFGRRLCSGATWQKIHRQSLLTVHGIDTDHNISAPLCTTPDSDTSTLVVDRPSKPSPTQELRLTSRHPLPPTGKLNLIRNGELIHVTEREMYDSLRHLPSESVLETFVANMTSMDKTHLAICLKRLHAVIHRLHRDKQEPYVKSLLEDDRFQVLVAVITHKGRFYDADIQYNILRALHEFGLTACHPSMKVFLQLIRHNVNKLYLDQLIQLVQIVDLLEPCEEKSLLNQAIEQLVVLRRDELKYLDDVEAVTLLEFFPDLLGKSHKHFLMQKITREISGIKLDHVYAHRLLRALAKNLHSRHPISDHRLLSRLVTTCHRMRHKYGPSEVTDVLLRFRELRVYRPELFDDFGDLLCVDAGLPDRVGILHAFCEQSHLHRGLLENVEASLDQGQPAVEDLARFLFCCWSYGYTFSNRETFTRSVDLLCRQLDCSQLISVDLFLELCLLLVTSECCLPDRLINAEVVPSSEYGWKEHKFRAKHEGPADGDSPLIVMPLEEEDKGTFIECYTLGWPVHRREVISIIKQRWSPLPASLEKIYSNSVTGETWKVRIPEFDLYLTSLGSEYNIQCASHLDCGLSVDFILSKKNNLEENEAVARKVAEISERLAVKLLPPSVTIRNYHRLKTLPAMYMSCVQSEGYKLLLITSNGWKAIPHGERESYLRWKVKQALSQTSEVEDQVCMI